MPDCAANGIKLHYEEWGSGPTILLLHGLGSSLRDWEAQLEALTGSYRVIAVDMRGHGQSDKPEGPYSVELWAADTAAFMDALNLDRAHIVGISMGAMIGFQLAVDHPDRLASLVAINAIPELRPRSLSERIAVAIRFVVVRMMGMQGMGEYLAPRLFPDPAMEDERQIFIERWAENDQRAYLDSMRALVGWSVVERLDRITCPVLMISSELDYTATATKAPFVGQMADARLIEIEDAHHAVTAEMPEQLNAVLVDFLKDVS